MGCFSLGVKLEIEIVVKLFCFVFLDRVKSLSLLLLSLLLLPLFCRTSKLNQIETCRNETLTLPLLIAFCKCNPPNKGMTFCCLYLFTKDFDMIGS